MKIHRALLSITALLLSASLATAGEKSTQKSLKAPAARETASVKGTKTAATGVAIWPSENPALTRLIGAQSPSEIALYDLNGTITQRIAARTPNAIAARDTFYWLDGEGGIIATSDSTDNSIAFYKIDPKTGTASPTPRSLLRTSIKGIAGLCMGQVGADLVLAATGHDGQVKVWTLALDPWGAATGLNMASFGLGADVSSCAIDDKTGALYLAETQRGIWRVDLSDPSGAKRKLIDQVQPTGKLTAPINALTIWSDAQGGQGFILATAGPAATLHLYHRATNNHPMATMLIGPSKNKKADTVTGGLGIAAHGGATGPDFPMGFIVVQDSENTKPKANPNFKIVSFTEIERLIPFE